MVSRTCLGIGLLLLGLGGLLAPRSVGAEDPAVDAPVDLSAKAIAAWEKTCQKCHAVPDPAFDTDRAFLRQILETT